MNQGYVGETGDDVYLSPAQYSWLLGARSVSAMPLGLLLFPQIEPKLDGMAIERLDPDQTLALLRQAAFSDRVTVGQARVFAPGAAPSAAIMQQLTRISREIPTWRCRLGPNAYTDQDTLARLFNAL